MSRSARVRALVFGTVLALAASVAWADPRPAREVAGSSWNLAGQVWQALVAAWSGLGIWNDAGCSADPNGLCAAGAADLDTATGDNGCSVDPNGGGCG